MTHYRIIWECDQPVIDVGIVSYVGKKTKQRKITSKRTGEVPSVKAWRESLAQAIGREAMVTCFAVATTRTRNSIPLSVGVRRICQLKRLQSKLEKHGLIP